MSRLQNNKAEGITAIMDEVKLDYHPVTMGIKRQDLVDYLKKPEILLFRARHI